MLNSSPSATINPMLPDMNNSATPASWIRKFTVPASPTSSHAQIRSSRSDWNGKDCHYFSCPAVVAPEQVLAILQIRRIADAHRANSLGIKVLVPLALAADARYVFRVLIPEVVLDVSEVDSVARSDVVRHYGAVRFEEATPDR